MAGSNFYSDLRDKVQCLGGYHNAHLHLDRSNTLDSAQIAQHDATVKQTGNPKRTPLRIPL